MSFKHTARHVLIAALATGSLGALPAVSAASAPPANGVRHIVTSELTYDNGSLARRLDAETWLDGDSAFWRVTDASLVTEGASDATGQYLYDPARNHLIHDKGGPVARDVADPATYGAQRLPASGTATIRGIAVEQRVAPAITPATSGAEAVHEVFYINPATGRLVRAEWDTTSGAVVDQLDVLTDEVLPDTPANHAQAGVHAYPGASVEEFDDSAATSATSAGLGVHKAHRNAKPKGKQHKAAKHRKATRRSHRTAAGR